jgi:hypothetical protein
MEIFSLQEHNQEKFVFSAFTLAFTAQVCPFLLTDYFAEQLMEILFTAVEVMEKSRKCKWKVANG